MKKTLLFLLILSLFLIFTGQVFSQVDIFDGILDYKKSEIGKKAYQRIERKDVEGALEILNKAIEEKRDLFEAYQTRSAILSDYKNDIDGAIADLDEASKIKPDAIFIYLSKAYLRKRNKKDFAGALKDYETAQKYAPDSVLLLEFKASMKSELKDYDGALAEIEKALNSVPDSIDLRVAKSNYLVLKNEIPQAIAYLQGFLDDFVKKKNGKLPKIRGEKVIKKIPKDLLKTEDGVVDTVSVSRYSQMNFYPNSYKDYQNQMAQISTARSLAKAFLLLSRMYISQNEINKAFNNLDTTLEIDRNQEEAYGLRGILYLSQGANEKAIEELSRAIKIADMPYFYLNRGIAFYLTRDKKQAQKDFDFFLKIYPDGEEILKLRISEADKLITK